MKKIFRKVRIGILAGIFAAMTQWSTAGEILTGFRYSNEQTPKGNEWESPENLALNKEQPRAWFFSFQDTESARKVLPENSAYWQSLDGTWKFNW